jgi:hypothetical protein
MLESVQNLRILLQAPLLPLILRGLRLTGLQACSPQPAAYQGQNRRFRYEREILNRLLAAMSALLFVAAFAGAQEQAASAAGSDQISAKQIAAQRARRVARRAAASEAKRRAEEKPASAQTAVPAEAANAKALKMSASPADAAPKSADKPAAKDKGDDSFFGVTVMDVQEPYEPPKEPVRKAGKGGNSGVSAPEPQKDEDAAADDSYEQPGEPVMRKAGRGKLRAAVAAGLEPDAADVEEPPSEAGADVMPQTAIAPDDKPDSK